MTLAVFAYFVMPGLALLVAIVGYVAIAISDPRRSVKASSEEASRTRS